MPGAAPSERSLLVQVGDRAVTLAGYGTQPQLNRSELGELLASLKRVNVSELPETSVGGQTRKATVSHLEGTIKDLEKLVNAAPKLEKDAAIRTVPQLLRQSDRATEQWEAGQSKQVAYAPPTRLAGSDLKAAAEARQATVFQYQDAMAARPDGPNGLTRGQQRQLELREEDRSPD